jgi:hypothetical protein
MVLWNLTSFGSLVVAVWTGNSPRSPLAPVASPVELPFSRESGSEPLPLAAALPLVPLKAVESDSPEAPQLVDMFCGG